MKSAIVVKSFTYINIALSDDEDIIETPIHVSPGTAIQVDILENIALLSTDYIAVSPDQYQLLS
jgi:hypothetical protein